MADIRSLGFTSAVLSVLRAKGINEVSELLGYNMREVSSFRGMGERRLRAFEETLRKSGLELAQDPFGAYTCARHGEPSWDTGLSSMFLCNDCSTLFATDAFRGTAPVYEGFAVEGFCQHCNRKRRGVRLRQWHLCGVCERVVTSIGRSVVANKSVMEWWSSEIQPSFPDLELTLTDPPELRPHDARKHGPKEVQVDFVVTNKGTPVFGIELKSGRSHIRGTAIGSKMGRFQLDTSDCDDILTGVRLNSAPIYVFHAQVIDRADPPTTHHHAVGLWWTDLFAMASNFEACQRRPRENRQAAYFRTGMFMDMSEFREHLEQNGPELMWERLTKQGVPRLYTC